MGPNYEISKAHTIKALLSPWGAYLILDLPPEGGGVIERGLIREGGLIPNLSHILRNQHTILQLKYTILTQFLFQTILKFTCKLV